MAISVTSTTEPRPCRKAKNQGMNWISQSKRLAIYLRDGIACCYCGATCEDGAQLSLDHLTPYCEGGTDHESNLVTACKKCNSSRGKRPVKVFVKAVAAYINHGIDEKAILAFIRKTVKRALDMEKAKALIESRGSCFKVLHPDS